MTDRPGRRIPHMITPAAYQEMKISDAPPPAALIALDAQDVKMIQEYRAAKQAWEKAHQAADMGFDDNMTTAHEALYTAEVTLALLIDYLAKKAGV